MREMMEQLKALQDFSKMTPEEQATSLRERAEAILERQREREDLEAECNHQVEFCGDIDFDEDETKAEFDLSGGVQCSECGKEWTSMWGVIYIE